MSGAQTPVISQIGYPGAGDVDDCWVVATVWAAEASRPGIRHPTVTEYRRHAGDPDDGVTDGGSLDEVVKGARGSWPSLDVTRWQSTAWDAFASLVKAGRPASVALDSAKLPPHLRFGFYGKHQVGVAWDAVRKTFVIANPLDKDGTPPKAISEAALRVAVLALLPQRQEVRAAVFPAVVVPPDTGMEEIVYSIPEAPNAYPGVLPKGTPVYSSPTDSTGTPTGAAVPVMVVAATRGATKTTGRRYVHGNHPSTTEVPLGLVDVGRIVR